MGKGFQNSKRSGMKTEELYQLIEELEEKFTKQIRECGDIFPDTWDEGWERWCTDLALQEIIDGAEWGHIPIAQELAPTQLDVVRACLINRAAATFQPGGDFLPSRYWPDGPYYEITNIGRIKLYDSRWKSSPRYHPPMHTSESADLAKEAWYITPPMRVCETFSLENLRPWCDMDCNRCP